MRIFLLLPILMSFAMTEASPSNKPVGSTNTLKYSQELGLTYKNPPTPEYLSKQTHPSYNTFILNQLPGLMSQNPQTSLLLFASALPLSRLIGPSDNVEGTPLSLLIDVDLNNLSHRTVLGLEYVF